MRQTLSEIDPRTRKAIEFVLLLVLLRFGAGIGGNATLTGALLALPALIVLGGLIYLFG